MDTVAPEISQLFSEFHNFTIANIISDDDIYSKSMQPTSVFRWSGQFPGGLAGVLLDRHSQKGDVILDPFAGSGTVLFEAAARSLECVGIDINPAAAALSETVLFCNLNHRVRDAYLNKLYSIVKKLIDSFDKQTKAGGKFTTNDYSLIKHKINSTKDPHLRNLLINVLMRLSISAEKYTSTGLMKSFEIHSKIIKGLPYSSKRCKVFNSDARELQLESGSVDLIITSPPYPGVFDYYKNYKKIMYLAGWPISETSKNEIGHGKGTGNKFLDIINYANDMNKALVEMRRVLKDDGRLILILNHESEIKNIRFQSSGLLYAIATADPGLQMVMRQERHFKSRSGADIQEDILHFIPSDHRFKTHNCYPAEAAAYFLEKAMPSSDIQSRKLLKDALNASIQLL
jgi:SAM-dependent methyltransferase